MSETREMKPQIDVLIFEEMIIKRKAH